MSCPNGKTETTDWWGDIISRNKDWFCWNKRTLGKWYLSTSLSIGSLKIESINKTKRTKKHDFVKRLKITFLYIITIEDWIKNLLLKNEFIDKAKRIISKKYDIFEFPIKKLIWKIVDIIMRVEAIDRKIESEISLLVLL